MNERSWNVVGIVGCLLGLLVVAYSVFLPVRPPTRKELKARTKEVYDMDAALKGDREKVTEVRAKNEARLWTQPQDKIGASAMAKVTSLAASHNLKIIAFRPQRGLEDGSLVRYPYTVSLEGAYPNVVEFVSGLETQAGKLVVHQVQLAASDGASDHVTATVGLSAYKELDAK